jgi:hypothetical protein
MRNAFVFGDVLPRLEMPPQIRIDRVARGHGKETEEQDRREHAFATKEQSHGVHHSGWILNRIQSPSIVHEKVKGERKSNRGFARLVVIGILGLHALLFYNLWQRIESGYPDFVVFYTAATILRDGRGPELYLGPAQSEVQRGITGQLPSRVGPLPYVHPPAEALIFVPLTRFSFRLAFVTWDLLNIAILFGVAWLLRADVGALRSIAPWELVLCSLAFFPVFESLLQGQDSILQLLLCVLAWKALRRKADALAGCWFALGAFKFQLMLPIMLLIVFWKRSRVLIGFAAVVVVLVPISIGLVGWQGLLNYPVFVLQVANTPSVGGVPPDFIPNLHGLVMGWPLHLSGAFATWLICLVSIGLFVFAAIRGRQASGWSNGGLQFLLAIGVSELIGWQTNVHDYSLLVLPLVLIAGDCLRATRRTSGHQFTPLYPALPILISPLWLLLWLVIGHMNLMAIPLLWWVWEVGKQLPRAGQSEVTAHSQP